MPALVISKSNLTDLKTVDSVIVSPIADFDSSLDNIKELIGKQDGVERASIMSFLKKTNDILVLRPTFLGFGVDLNKALKKIIGA